MSGTGSAIAAVAPPSSSTGSCSPRIRAGESDDHDREAREEAATPRWTDVAALTPMPASDARSSPPAPPRCSVPRAVLTPLELYVALLDEASALACVTFAFTVPAPFKAALDDNTANGPLIFMLLEKRGPAEPAIHDAVHAPQREEQRLPGIGARNLDTARDSGSPRPTPASSGSTCTSRSCTRSSCCPIRSAPTRSS